MAGNLHYCQQTRMIGQETFSYLGTYLPTYLHRYQIKPTILASSISLSRAAFTGPSQLPR